MKDTRPSLILFVVAGLLVMIAKIFSFEEMMLLTKPMVVPSIYYYYLQTKRSGTNAWFSIAVWSFFIADMIMILFSKSGVIAIMCCCLLSYLILIKFAVDDCRRIKFNSFNVIIITLLLLLLCYVVFSILTLSMHNIVRNFPLYLLYGIVLIAVGTISVVNYLSDSSAAFFYFCIMALCMIVSDFFFCIDRYIIQMPIIDHINLFAQFVSYFFMVRYFNSRKTEAVRSKIKSTQ